MIRYNFIPTWRRSQEVEVVLHPHAGWFRKLTHVRFALMEDGDLYFGDGMTVLHQDMCNLHSPTNARPLLAGVMVRHDAGRWRFGYIQYFARGSNEAAPAKKLLRKMDAWREMVRVLGEDPTRAATWDELGRRR
jgi:hypothetical protein